MAVMKYQTKITLYNSYFDYNNKISPAKVLAIFQDVAAHHAEEIGVGYEKMLKNQKSAVKLLTTRGGVVIR